MSEREHERERKIDAVIASIARGDLTVDRLQTAIANGRGQVQRLGQRIEPTTLDALAAGEEALALIEREQLKLAEISL